MKKNIGARSRRKGHEAERQYAKEFRNLGYKHCKTSREGSRLLDSAGIDLIFIPFNVQIKAGKQRGLNPINELKLRTERTKKATPKTGIVFAGRKSLAEKRKVLSDRIAQLELHITNTKTDLAIAARRSGAWRTPDSRVPAWKEKMANYQRAVKTLKKQRAELRR